MWRASPATTTSRCAISSGTPRSSPRARTFPAPGPFGPFLVTPDEVGPLGPQRIQTRLNGQVVQDARLEQMIFNVPKLIAYFSLWTKLRPGDVIVTGTPGGVGAGRDPPLWMKPGDEVEVEIEGVGLLRNPIVAEASLGRPARPAPAWSRRDMSQATPRAGSAAG